MYQQQHKLGYYSHTQSFNCSHTHSLIRSLIHTHTHTLIHSCKHSHTHRTTYSHTCIFTLLHTCTPAHAPVSHLFSTICPTGSFKESREKVAVGQFIHGTKRLLSNVSRQRARTETLCAEIYGQSEIDVDTFASSVYVVLCFIFYVYDCLSVKVIARCLNSK